MTGLRSILLCAVLFIISIALVVASDQTSSVESITTEAPSKIVHVDHSLDNNSGDFPTKEGWFYHQFRLSSIRFISAFISSMSMIIVSEIGDKTFFIAAIMAMRHGRGEIFISAMAALALMTVLSAVMGFTLPNILPPHLTHALATALFFFFGIKLLYDASKMDNAAPLDEMEEVEHELNNRESDNNNDSASLLDLEKGGANKNKSAHVSGPDLSKTAPRLKTFLRKFFSPVFIQCFTMTFLAEWGDRSQIATIALAAAKDPYGVTFGGVMGHSICTGIAVIGGKLLATKISERTIAVVGGLLFLVFSIHSVLSGDV